MYVQATNKGNDSARMITFENVSAIHPCICADDNGLQVDANRIYFDDGTFVIIPSPWKLWVIS